MVDENLKKNPEKRILHITVRSDIGGGPKHLNDLSRTLSEKFNFFSGSNLRPRSYDTILIRFST